MTEAKAGAKDSPGVRSPSEPEPGTKLAYSITQVVQATGLSRDLLYNEMRAGRLAYLKIGRRRIITRQQLEAFLAAGAA
jgi:excisionase family DNA binding protein